MLRETIEVLRLNLPIQWRWAKLLPPKRNKQNTGIEFEQLILQLTLKMGFESQTTKISGDGGIDIIAVNNQLFLVCTINFVMSIL